MAASENPDTPRAQKLRRRRLAVHNLHGQGLSVREIADHLKVAKSTVGDDIKAGRPQIQEPPACAAEPGNQRAVTHGAYSERTLAPLRDEAVEYARDRWPWLEDHDRAALERFARLSARVQVLANYEERNGPITDEATGRVFQATQLLSQLEERLHKLVTEFDLYEPPKPPPSWEDRVAIVMDPELQAQGRELLRAVQSGPEALADPEVRKLSHDLLLKLANPGPSRERDTEALESA